MSTRPLIITPGNALPSNPKKRDLVTTASAIKIMDDFAAQSAKATNDHVRRMINMSFRYGYRCALVDCVPLPGLVTAERIKERAQFYLNDQYEDYT